MEGNSPSFTQGADCGRGKRVPLLGFTRVVHFGGLNVLYRGFLGDENQASCGLKGMSARKTAAGVTHRQMKIPNFLNSFDYDYCRCFECS